MLLSYPRRCAFIHVPKSAGMSIRGALTQAMRREVLLPRGHQFSAHAPMHCTALEFRSYLGEAVWDSFFTFAFVRNPWSRMVSWFNFYQQHHWRQMGMRAPSPHAKDFVTFLEYQRKTRLDQVDYLSDKNGNLIVEFIGKYENLTEDFDHICARLAIEARLPHRHRTAKVDYHDYYADYSRDLVAELFARDIETFGYEF